MLNRPDDLLFLLAGIVLLVAGRRLFWLFVGVVGFAVGFHLSMRLFGSGREGLQWIVAIGAGLLGVVLAIAVQRAAIALAGFFVGAWGAGVLLHLDLAHLRPTGFLICVVAGVIAALLALRLFEGALIALSSFAGAELIVAALHQGRGLETALLLGLTLLGILIQAGATARGRRSNNPR